MPALRTLVTGLLAVAYVAAAVAPCETPGTESASARAVSRDEDVLTHGGAHSGQAHHGRAHASQAHSSQAHQGEHAAHPRDATGEAEATGADAHSDEGHCHEAPSLIPRCPCGCDEKSGARVPGGRLGPTLLASPLPALPPGAPPEVSSAPVGHADASPGSPDKIPI